MSLFRQVRHERVETLERARGKLEGAMRIFTCADGFTVFVPLRLVRRACAIGRREKPHEWMGLLLGERCRDDEGDFVCIEEVVLDPDAEAGENSVASSPGSEARMRSHARSLFPDLTIVGWTHGHLGHGAYYSEVDRRNQRSWSDANAVGIVFDPWSKPNMAVFRGPDSEPLQEVEAEESEADRQLDDRAHGSLEGAVDRSLPPRAAAAAPARGGRFSRALAATTLTVAVIALVVATFALGQASAKGRDTTVVRLYELRLQLPRDASAPSDPPPECPAAQPERTESRGEPEQDDTAEDGAPGSRATRRAARRRNGRHARRHVRDGGDA